MPARILCGTRLAPPRLATHQGCLQQIAADPIRATELPLHRVLGQELRAEGLPLASHREQAAEAAPRNTGSARSAAAGRALTILFRTPKPESPRPPADRPFGPAHATPPVAFRQRDPAVLRRARGFPPARAFAKGLRDRVVETRLAALRALG